MDKNLAISFALILALLLILLEGVFSGEFLIAAVLFSLSIIIISSLAPSTYKNLCFNLQLSSISTFLTLISLSILLRVVPPAQRGAYEKCLEHSQNALLNYFYSPLSVCVGKAVGDLTKFAGTTESAEYRDESFETDAFGMVNPQSVLTSDIDLLVLGDSYGLGVGLPIEQSWPRLLSKEKNLKMYNLSLPGSPAATIHRSKIIIPKLKLSDQAKVIWLLFAGNDLIDDYSILFAKDKSTNTAFQDLLSRIDEYGSKSPARLYLSSIFQKPASPENVTNITSDAGKMILYNKYIKTALMNGEDIKAHPNLPLLKQSLNDFRAIVNSYSLKPLVVLAPSKEEIYGPAASKNPSDLSLIISLICKDFNLKYVDLKPEFLKILERVPGTQLWWNDDTHLGLDGHKLLSQSMSSQIN